MAGSLRDPDVLAAIQAARTPRPGASGPFASPADWRDGWIYFLMVDRFNNPDAPPVHQPYDDPDYYKFQGGTFRGVQAQLKYIKDLGASAIWISPALKNLGWDTGSYHGYGIHDFLVAEPRFATSAATADAELRALVDAAHAVGLWVILDIVLNHVGNAFAYSPGDPGTVPGVPFSPQPLPAYWRLPDGTPRPDPTPIEQITGSTGGDLVWPSELQQNAYFRRQGNPQAGGDDTIGDFDTLRQMRTDNPAVQEALIAAYEYVIARFDPDGFRIDTLRYLKGDLPRQFGNAVREFTESLGKRNFFTFGEVLDNTAENDIARFIGRNTLDVTNDQLVGVDAALDYPLFFTLKPVVKGLAAPTRVIGMYDQRKTVEADIVSSHGDATRFFVTFLDNHDMKERIRYEAPGNPTEFDDQVTLGLACLFALPGIPCVYYGTEQGLHGALTRPCAKRSGAKPGSRPPAPSTSRSSNCPRYATPNQPCATGGTTSARSPAIRSTSGSRPTTEEYSPGHGPSPTRNEPLSPTPPPQHSRTYRWSSTRPSPAHLHHVCCTRTNLPRSAPARSPRCRTRRSPRMTGRPPPGRSRSRYPCSRWKSRSCHAEPDPQEQLEHPPARRGRSTRP